MKSIKSLVIAFTLFLLTSVTLTVSFATNANELSPFDVARTAGDNLFSEIVKNDVAIKADPKMMTKIVEEQLMPYIDHRYAAYMILGKHLKKTTKEQRENFVESMRHYLVQTYAKALAQYNNEKVTFEPASDYSGKRIVPIKAIVENPNKDLVIVFKMRQNSKTNEWKAFDMVVEGISLLSSKQAEFASKIRTNGIEHVTNELAKVTSE